MDEKNEIFRGVHLPVLEKEILEGLNPEKNKNFVDCTIGQGGHTKKILERISPNGKVLGIDLDKSQIENCRELLKDFSDRLILENDSYANLEKIISKNNFFPVNGILADLGMSSWHLQKSGRGFSFLKDEPLDMRYDGSAGELTASEIINQWRKEEIEQILMVYGEERFARKMSEKIVEQRRLKKIDTTLKLIEVLKLAVPRKFQNGKIHFVTRVFQALRITVNGELDNLKKLLPQSINILEKNGRLAIISFHSLEDRIVKNFFKEEAKKETIKILTKKPIVSTDEEARINPASRSAKLRVVEKL